MNDIEDNERSNLIQDKHSFEQEERDTIHRKNHRLLTCVFVALFPILMFIIFSTIYFSPISLPTEHLSVVSIQQPRILTYNIFMRPPGVKNNKDDYKDERLDYIIQNILPSYDIIALQEAFAFANKRIDRLIEAAFDQGFQYYLHSPRHYPWDLAGDGGLLLLSRLSIKKTDRIEFSRGVHSDWFSLKGVLHALIEVDKDHLIHIYTSHTQASYDDGGQVNNKDTQVRLEQFANIHEFIKDTASQDDWPIILMGDLNVNAALSPNQTNLNTPSYQSSLAYTMMMDVLCGQGTNLNLINSQQESALSYTSPWKLNLTDIPYKEFGYHPVTYGDYKKLANGTLVPAETALTSKSQLLTVQSIDRLLWSGSRMQNRTMFLSNITIEHFFTESLPFTQISDHYGISAILNIQK